ncbi:hypothetical protein J3458_001554 [Metarhizium acridum]|uniref:uncharacterized protein n=1 Tax=Metarhizium acridum TaxID=92637 RepID=UPI001C6C9D90|nr:hypothetical protein J3458_001554 [Metarhizium acridum]
MSKDNDQLSVVRKRISETMAAVEEEQRELINILAFLSTISKEARQQMSESASGSQGARRRKTGLTIDQSGDYYQRRVVEKEQAIGRMWEKIHDLQVEERQLKETLEQNK